MRAMTLNGRVGGLLAEHVGESIGEYGHYENVSEYVRDLIRGDLGRVETERFAILHARMHRSARLPEALDSEP